MPNSVISELEVHNVVYDIHGKANVNNNSSTSQSPTPSPYVFDWIGTQQQYVDQDIEQDHPEWLCFITDDITGGYSVYTKSEIDAAVVHKDSNETITGTKVFEDNTSQVALVTKSQTIDNSVIPSTTQFSNFIDNQDVNGNLLSRVFTAKNSSDENIIAIQAWDGSTNYSVQVTSTGKCILPPNTYGTNFNGTASSALWADLAEKYEMDDMYSKGTLIKFGGSKDITIADDKCNGIISDKPGFLLSAGQPNSLPVALEGKTPVRIIGKVKKFDPITLSETPGVGRVAKEGEKIIARALESSNEKEEKLVMCVTKFNLD